MAITDDNSNIRAKTILINHSVIPVLTYYLCRHCSTVDNGQQFSLEAILHHRYPSPSFNYTGFSHGAGDF
jgi:hypothetical protein